MQGEQPPSFSFFRSNFNSFFRTFYLLFLLMSTISRVPFFPFTQGTMTP